MADWASHGAVDGLAKLRSAFAEPLQNAAADWAAAASTAASAAVTAAAAGFGVLAGTGQMVVPPTRRLTMGSPADSSGVGGSGICVGGGGRNRSGGGPSPSAPDMANYTSA
jgi:hypothetical protein